MSANPASTNPATMTSDPLANLRDIHLPEPVSWWPLAPGWWVLIALGIALLIWLALILIARWRANSYRRQALRELDQLQRSGETSTNQVLALLRRSALGANPGSDIASKPNEELFSALQNSSSSELFTFNRDHLDAALYGSQPPPEELKTQLLSDARRWLKTHRRGQLC